MDRSARAKEILSNLRYITIATATKDGQPWNTPVFASYDERYNFYWASWTGTQHSQNIRENPNVFLVAYDSTVPEGSGEGVYVKATAEELNDPDDITRALTCFYARKNKTPRRPEEFMGEYPRRMYKAVPEKFWVNFDIDVKGNPIDTRKEIAL